MAAAANTFHAAGSRACGRSAAMAVIVALAVRAVESARVSGAPRSNLNVLSSTLHVDPDFEFKCRRGPFGDEVVWTMKTGEEFGYATTVRNSVCSVIEQNKAQQRVLWQNHFSEELFAVATYAFIMRPSTLSMSFDGATAMLEGAVKSGKFYLTLRGAAGGQPFTDSRHFLLPCKIQGKRVVLSELRRAAVQVWRVLNHAPDSVDAFFLGLDVENDLWDLGLALPSAPLGKQVWQFARHVREEFDGKATDDKQAHMLVSSFGPTKLKDTKKILNLGKIVGYTAALTKLSQGPVRALKPEFLGFPAPQRQQRSS
mmetsp:Transcript_64675/g.187436  ORF Transcript_64675/g.187436 Transcript_64675/m.187436 type:complete len:313 (-) Transcript_64675:11-949(-)